MSDKPETDIETEFPKEVHNLLAGAQSAHIQLSAMADSKASILMGATFVIFSLAIGQAGSKALSVPMLLLGGFSFAAAVLSVMAILPSIRSKRLSGSTNYLFFGNFAQMPQQEFVDHMIDTMRSEEQVYRAMARDLYQNGVILHRRKYRYLGYAYRTFLAGMMVTVGAYIWQSVAA